MGDEPFGFECQEVSGTEIILVPDHLQDKPPQELTAEDLAELKALTEKPLNETMVTEFQDLKPGSVIMVYTVLEMWDWARVDSVDEEKQDGIAGIAKSPDGSVGYILCFNEDDRHCWACIGSGNLAGLKKLDLRKEYESPDINWERPATEADIEEFKRRNHGPDE